MVDDDTSTKQLLVYDATAGNSKWQAAKKESTKSRCPQHCLSGHEDAADYVADYRAHQVEIERCPDGGSWRQSLPDGGN